MSKSPESYDRNRTDKPNVGFLNDECHCVVTFVARTCPTPQEHKGLIVRQVNLLSDGGPERHPNRLLASLPGDALQALAPFSNTVSLKRNTLLAEAGDELDHVYFPHDGMLSLLTIMRDGNAIEVATIGREGMVGGSAALGIARNMVRVTVQLPLTATRMAMSRFRAAAVANEVLRDIGIRSNEVLLSQARVTAACNALHSIESRFCRWLLQSADRAGGDTVALTQEFLAEMLGVRRTSVTEVAGKLQHAGVIAYSRGVIKILDRPGLEKISCECYQTLVEQSAIVFDDGTRG